MATSTDKLAPRIIINENDILPRDNLGWRHPITLLFGFSPTGRTCEMVKCDTANDILQEFGFPTSAPEKYFIDSALRLVQQNATVLMTRLPYDNPQSHTVKYVDYKVEDAISMRDIATLYKSSMYFLPIFFVSSVAPDWESLKYMSSLSMFIFAFLR